jgi:diaminopropionate ammonia-lyase
MMVGLNCGTPSLVAWPLISAGFDWCVTVEDRRAAEAMRWLAGAGIVSGETGAAATAGFDALVEERVAGLGPHSTVLLLSTEGATDEAHYRDLVGRDPAEVGRDPAGRPAA